MVAITNPYCSIDETSGQNTLENWYEGIEENRESLRKSKGLLGSPALNGEIRDNHVKENVNCNGFFDCTERKKVMNIHLQQKVNELVDILS